MFFFSHSLPPKAVKRCPHIGYREMQRQVEDQLGPSFSRHVHPAASPTVKPESHDPPPLCAWGERQWSRSRGAPRSNLVAQSVGSRSNIKDAAIVGMWVKCTQHVPEA